MIASRPAFTYGQNTLGIEQPLLIALVAVQFGVHALGWAMAAGLSRGWRAAEGQFAAFWFLLALGLALLVPAWPSGSAPRNIANVLLVGAAVLQHRGLVLYWGGTPRDGRYLVGVLLATLLVVLSLALERGHGARVATVCAASSVMLGASAWEWWAHGRRRTPRYAVVLTTTLTLLAVALMARAVQALWATPPAKVAIDAPGTISLAMVILVLVMGGLINLAQIQLVLGRVLRRLTSLALTDPLTGAVNRRGFIERLNQAHQRALRAANGMHGYAVLMVDVDHFKAVNDRLGHAEGDRVLQHVALTLRETLRTGDVVARWGGEEFCVLLSRVNEAEAHALAVRMAARIANSGEPRVTVSVGVAQAHPATEGSEDVVRRADAALYRAKAAGRNRVEAAPLPGGPQAQAA